MIKNELIQRISKIMHSEISFRKHMKKMLRIILLVLAVFLCIIFLSGVSDSIEPVENERQRTVTTNANARLL